MKRLAQFLTLATIFCSVAVAQNVYVYVADYGANSISAYSANPVTGTLTEVPNSPFPAGSNPIYLPLDKQCRFLYAPNVSSNDVSAYVIDQNTGGLTGIPNSPYQTGSNPVYSALDQTGQFLYVPNQGNNNISVFAVNGDSGSLSQVSNSPFDSGGSAPGQVFVDPLNRFAFVPEVLSNAVSVFRIDSKTGALSLLGSWSTGGSEPKVARTDNTGHFLYVSNRSSLAIFSIDQNSGALTPVNGSPLSFGGGDLYGISIDPSNKFAYVGSNFQGVYGFSIDQNTGALTPLPGFPIQNDSPQGNPVFAIEPTRGVMYMSSFGGSNTITTWTIDPNSGALTQIPGSAVPTGAFPGNIATCSADADGALARLLGGNTFTGDQTINGNVSASAFSGSGAGLTNVNASALGGVAASSYARLDVGNVFAGNQSVSGSLAASSFSGNGSGLTNVAAATAATATNALALGGNAPSFYATLGSNVFTGGQTMPTLTIGGGTPINEYVSLTQVITLPSIGPQTCSTFTTSALTNFNPGATDSIALGVPASLVTGLASGVFLTYQAWETSTAPSPTITIQVCNVSGKNYKGGNTGTVRIDVFKH